MRPESSGFSALRCMPSHALELADTRAGDPNALRGQQRPLHALAPAVAAEAAAGGNYPVTRDVGPPTAAHDVADGPGRAGPAGQCGDVSVGRDPPRWDPPHHGEHALREPVDRRGLPHAVATARTTARGLRLSSPCRRLPRASA